MVREQQKQSALARSVVNVSELFPLLSKKRDPLTAAFFGPVALTLAVIVSLLWVQDSQVLATILLVWLGALSVMFIHAVCGRPRPLLWTLGGLLLGILGAELIPLYYKAFPDPNFRQMIATASEIDAQPFVSRFWFWLMNAGMPEELVKALPVIAGVVIAMRVTSPLAERIGVFTPLQGVLLGAASGIGFTINESYGYAMAQLQHGNDMGALMQVLIRNLAQFGEHPAWAGYVGYCLGLGMVRRRQQLALAVGGWLLSSTLHATFNSTVQAGPRSLNLLIVIGSWGLLASAVLKGRQLAAGSRAGDRSSAAPAARSVAASQPVVTTTGGAVVWARVDTNTFQLRLGDRVLASQVTGVSGSTDEAVAEIVSHPTDRKVLGLRNRSSESWTAVVPAGDEQEVRPGQSVTLSPGVRVHLGDSRIVIEKVV